LFETHNYCTRIYQQQCEMLLVWSQLAQCRTGRQCKEMMYRKMYQRCSQGIQYAFRWVANRTVQLEWILNGYVGIRYGRNTVHRLYMFW